MSSKSEDYVPLMCTHQSAISRELVEGDPRVPGIFALLLIRCRVLLNGGRFENAREGFLLSEIERGFTGLTLDLAEIILAGDKPPFWHWEGNALVVDGYYLQAETSLINLREGGRRGGLHSAEKRKRQRRKTLHKTLKNKTEHESKPPCSIKREISPEGDISNSPSPLGAGVAFDDEEYPCNRPATPEEVRTIFAGIFADEQDV